jgi:engulfment/cell motility protein 1
MRCNNLWFMIMVGPVWTKHSFTEFVFPFSGDLQPLTPLQVGTILSSPHAPINVCRPATAIIKRLVEADARFNPSSQPSSSRSVPPPAPGSIWRYGFEAVWEQIREVSEVSANGSNSGVLDVIVQRLASADSGMAIYRFVCITSPHRQILGC